MADLLLDRAADVGEHVAGVGADQADCAYYDHEDDREHDGILGYVLPLLFCPEFGYEIFHDGFIPLRHTAAAVVMNREPECGTLKPHGSLS